MRRIALTVLGFALMLSGVPLFSQMNATVEKALESKEKAGWQAWKDHDAKPLDGLFTDNSISVADGGVFRGKEQLVKSITDARCVVNSFSLSDFSYMWLDKDTVVMTYSATQDATCDGKKQAGKVFATSIWQKKGSKWLSPFHQETEAGSM
ncbi:MAG TPA: nuclear transport factor 2 family protein [Candidatus Sulfotelmatobacter sp.]